MLRGRDNWKENSNAFFFVNLKTTERTFTRTKIKKMGREGRTIQFLSNWTKLRLHQ